MREILDRFPYFDGGSRRNLITGGIIVIGMTFIFREYIPSQFADITAYEILSAPTVAIIFALLVFAVGSVANLLGEHFLVVLMSKLFNKFVLSIRTIKKSDKADALLLRLPEHVAKGFYEPFGIHGEFSSRFVLNMMNSENKAWASNLNRRVKDTLSTTTAIFILLICSSGKFLFSFGSAEDEQLRVNVEAIAGRMETTFEADKKIISDAIAFLELALTDEQYIDESGQPEERIYLDNAWNRLKSGIDRRDLNADHFIYNYFREEIELHALIVELQNFAGLHASLKLPITNMKTIFLSEMLNGQIPPKEMFRTLETFSTRAGDGQEEILDYYRDLFVLDFSELFAEYQANYRRGLTYASVGFAISIWMFSLLFAAYFIYLRNAYISIIEMLGEQQNIGTDLPIVVPKEISSGA